MKPVIQNSLFNKTKGELRAFADTIDDSELRLKFSRSICGTTLNRFWLESCKKNDCSWNIIDPFEKFEQPEDTNNLKAQELGVYLSTIPFLDSSFLIGTLYTALLPNEWRATNGAYYTPPSLVNHLISMVSEQGFDWQRGKILDPACGGGAFLSPVALRMFESLPKKITNNPDKTITEISERLSGFEIDPFSAWISQTLVEMAFLPQCIEAEKRFPQIVTVCDSLIQIPTKTDLVDLVIGNPPYCKTPLSPELRNKYSRSLFGHANLYGIFTDMAITWAKPNGYIAYVTPTSFLGGQYFKSLRALLSTEAQPVAMDFVSERKGVFEEVLQDTMLVVYNKNNRMENSDKNTSVNVHSLKSNGDGKTIIRKDIGRFQLPVGSEDPWLIPKEPEQIELVDKIIKMPGRFNRYGFEIITGQLVWNRNKDRMCSEHLPGSYPIIWADAIGTGGEVKLKSNRPHRLLYFMPSDMQEFLITKKPCILIKRTTAKEQKRRIFASLLPQNMISNNGGVVIENHVNIIKPISEETTISLDTLIALLNSDMFDMIYRLISGSVAVSAFELNNIPLPSLSSMKKLETQISHNASKEIIEKSIKKMYLKKLSRNNASH
jgi:adenine-specific DNA-methyltransferase